MNTADKSLIRVLSGATLTPPPIWVMRQAGRYLPEYRKIRQEAGSFLDLCFTPELAAEVTLQPIRRFGFDAAILFSDILVVPHALGQKVWFEEGRGPRLQALEIGRGLADLSLETMQAALEPVYQAIGLIKRDLPEATALIGFAGAPWTVASYMIEGGSSRDFSSAKAWAYGQPELFQSLIDLLVEATSQYLVRQVAAGAEALQIFDSWAGAWPAEEMRRWCLTPMRQIVSQVKARHPDVPIVLFPRGAGVLYREFATTCGAEALALDTGVPLVWAKKQLQTKAVLQGNLDPVLLLTGGDALKDRVARTLDVLGGGPFVFNLGHGILPETSPDHVGELLEMVRAC